jgi:hypothetical protein
MAIFQQCYSIVLPKDKSRSESEPGLHQNDAATHYAEDYKLLQLTVSVHMREK